MASTLLYGHRLDCILKMLFLLFHNRAWRWKYSSKLKCSSIATTCLGVNKVFKWNSNRNQEQCCMFHFMVVKESQPYFYFIYILKFKLRWKLWLMIEIFLLRLLSPAQCCGCMHVLGTFQFSCVCARFFVPAILLYKIPIIGFCSEIQLSNTEPTGHILVWRSPGRVKFMVLVFQAYCLGSSSIKLGVSVDRMWVTTFLSCINVLSVTCLMITNS